MARYEVRAYNTATQSDNKIHDDAVASRLGFSGGLVPGVDVYAYLCHGPAARWGLEWLECGTMQARFHSPVYDGEVVAVETTESPDGSMTLELTDPRGTCCATATASVNGSRPPVELLPLTSPPRRDERPAASPEVLAPGTVLGHLDVGFHAEHAGAYLADVREDLPLFRDEGVAHPGWLLRQANYVLTANARLGPWIHVESECTHLGLVVDGDRMTVRGRVEREYERKGHRFVELAVQWIVDDVAVMVARHVAIYEPRGVSAAGSGR
ncbi:MAG TPA: hypothetical protein VF230_01820 [Acidimicrobiales bacterium]